MKQSSDRIDNLTGWILHRYSQTETCSNASVRFHTCLLIGRTWSTVTFLCPVDNSSRRCKVSLPGRILHLVRLIEPDGGLHGHILLLTDETRIGQQVQSQRLASPIVIARIGELKPSAPIIGLTRDSLDITPRLRVDRIAIYRRRETTVVFARQYIACRRNLLGAQYSVNVFNPSVSW